ncbi:MAG: hypothetical protein WC856_06480 [Methylococcaceae bacterium]|jgi:hypothetical protein
MERVTNPFQHKGRVTKITIHLESLCKYNLNPNLMRYYNHMVVMRWNFSWQPVCIMLEKISFASAAHMAGLDFDAFKTRLSEHFE